MPGPSRSLTAERINSHLHESGISKPAFAIVVGMPLSGLKDSLSGRTYAGAEVEAGWLAAAARLHEFVKALRPMVLIDGHAMKKLLEGDVTPDTIRAMVEQIFGE